MWCADLVCHFPGPDRACFIQAQIYMAAFYVSVLFLFRSAVDNFINHTAAVARRPILP